MYFLQSGFTEDHLCLHLGTVMHMAADRTCPLVNMGTSPEYISTSEISGSQEKYMFTFIDSSERLPEAVEAVYETSS